MRRRRTPPGKVAPAPAAGDDLHAAVLDLIQRGRHAQEAVDRILAAEPERRGRQRERRSRM